VKLAYRDTAAYPSGAPAIVLHREGLPAADDLTGLVSAEGTVGRVVAPFGDYAYTATGMEVAGLCWYRILPGFAGTDRISLAKAVVQVCDLVDDLDLEQPSLIGWGQGGVVALGAGLLRPAGVESVVCIDVPATHVGLLPETVVAHGARPRVLSAATDGADAATAEDLRTCLGHRGIDAVTWQWSGEGDHQDRNDALARRIGEWLEDGRAGRTG
jgi:pimeloyl-ACP methyl ester carboxylesterase